MKSTNSCYFTNHKNNLNLEKKTNFNYQFRYFEYLAEYLDHRLSYIPLTFMLGFFVSSVMGRWKSLFHSLGHIEEYVTFLSDDFYISK